jgi:hypothetical protein
LAGAKADADPTKRRARWLVENFMADCDGIEVMKVRRKAFFDGLREDDEERFSFYNPLVTFEQKLQLKKEIP